LGESAGWGCCLARGRPAFPGRRTCCLRGHLVARVLSGLRGPVVVLLPQIEQADDFLIDSDGCVLAADYLPPA
jgi:hypothetical protein